MAPGDCCSPPPPASYKGKGTEELWDGLDVYTVGSSTSSSAVLFVTDVYGWRIPQSRYLADKIAAHGYYVAVPDLMHNDFYASSDPNDEYADLPIYLPKHPIVRTYLNTGPLCRHYVSVSVPEVRDHTIEYDIYVWKIGGRSAVRRPHSIKTMNAFLLEKNFFMLKSYVHFSGSLEECNDARVEGARVVEQLRSKGFKKVGAVGNCWGAKIVISLLPPDKGVDAAVLQHPSFLTKEEIGAVSVPLAILGASIDIITTPAAAMEFGEILKASPKVGDKNFVKIFPDVDHGWTTRYDLEDEVAHKKACEAHDELLAWFAKYLSP